MLNLANEKRIYTLKHDRYGVKKLSGRKMEKVHEDEDERTKREILFLNYL